MEAHIFEQQFEALLQRYIQFIIRDIHQGIQRARDKHHTKMTTKQWIEGVLNHFQSTEIVGELCVAFVLSYKEGYEIKNTLIELHQEYIKRVSEYPYFDIDNNSIDKAKKNKRKASFSALLTKAFLRYLAFTKIAEKYDEIISCQGIGITESALVSKAALINWTNIVPTKENKNDFVQLIYALHQAGYINYGRGEITKIVEAAAIAFNVKLGNNWQSNHSASIHKAKRDYEPPIFRKIQDAYKNYTHDLIDDKRKKR